MPYHLRPLRGFKWEPTVADLRAADLLVVYCHGCSKRFFVAPHHLYARFPPSTRLHYVNRSWMVCRNCGARGEDILTYHVEEAFPPCEEV